MRREKSSSSIEQRPVGREVATLRALAHETRNALQHGHASLSLLRLKLNERPDLLSLIDQIAAGQAKLETLCETARRHAEPATLELARADLVALVRVAWARVVPDAVAPLVLATRSPTTVDADPVRAVEAIEGVLRNAVQAAGERNVEILVADAGIDDHRALAVDVRDGGPGIGLKPPERALEPFTTTRKNATGMGLATAAKLIEAHGGDLSVLASGPSGTTVRIRFPVARS